MAIRLQSFLSLIGKMTPTFYSLANRGSDFVTAGNIDSMVAHYTVAKRKRSDDAYTAGGKTASVLTEL